MTKKKHNNQKTRLNLILDLDETIIQGVNFPNWVRDETSHHLFPLIGTSFPVLQNRAQTTKDKNIEPNIIQVFLRPYFMNFLDYCFDAFDVSIWTSSTEEYCINILKKLEILDKCKHIFYRRGKKAIRKYIPKDRQISNILEKEEIEVSEFFDHVAKRSINFGVKYRSYYKPLDTLWNDTYYNKIFNQNNTFIIDDLAENYIQYPDNVILIPAWCHLNWSDKFLKITIDKLKDYLSNKRKIIIKDLCHTVNTAYRYNEDIERNNNWQTTNGKQCRNEIKPHNPEHYYKSSISHKDNNIKLLLKGEKRGTQKIYNKQKKSKQKKINKNKQK